MGNFVAIHVLKQYNPGTFNRGEDGEAKQIMVGGVNRARFSSQCQKRAIRELMACEEIRTANVQDLISKCLDVKVVDGTISEDEKNVIGEAICSKAIIGSDCWNTGKKSEVVCTTNKYEIDALINAFIEEIKTNGIEGLKKDCKDKKRPLSTKIAATAALNDVYISSAKALFGTMATDGVLGTVDGAVQIGQAYSVDAYLPEADFFTVKYVGRYGNDSSDPFFGAYESFDEIESQKKMGETINSGLSLYSNLMYSYANVNLKELQRNLNTIIYPRKYVPNESTNEIIMNVVPKFIQAMIEMVPEATQNRSSSHVEPAVVLIEVIKDGANLQPDWSKVIKANQLDITEQAIDRLANFANNKTFRSGEISQYVMLGSNYTALKEKFNDAIELTNLNTLNQKLREEISPLI